MEWSLKYDFFGAPANRDRNDEFASVRYACPDRNEYMPGVLCTALPSDKERKAAGRALRDKIKRGDLGCWRPRKDRADPVDLIEEARAGRLERLVPVRVGRIDGLEEYLKTLPPHWHRVLSSYVVVDVAHKVAGVGSVGLRAFVAKGYARSTGATMLSGYLGKGDVADRAFARFARAYADQTEAVHQALQRAVKSGRLPAEHGTWPREDAKDLANGTLSQQRHPALHVAGSASRQFWNPIP